MNSFIPVFIMFCMLNETVVSVSISFDRPSTGQVILTCSITNFSGAATWSKGTTLISCVPGGPCSPAQLGKYNFSANASAIIVQISSFVSGDELGWQCKHDVNKTTVTNVFTSNPGQGVLAGGLSLGTQCLIICIVVVIFKCTGCKRPYILGLGLGLGLGITFIVGCIIIASLILTGTTSSKLELGLGLGLGSGIPCLITIIIAVIFIFKGIPSRVECGNGILKGLCIASVIGHIVYLIYTKCKTKNPGSSSAVSREQVQVQMENKGVKDYDEERPPAVHTRTQNKVELNTNSKQTNHRQQPVPPANTGFEDTPTCRRLPQPPQKPDLASETPRPNRLRPLTPKQATVQKEDASEEPKKKRKKKKKKDQMNVETPEEENGETDLRVT